MNACCRALVGLAIALTVLGPATMGRADNLGQVNAVDSTIESIGLFKNGLAVVRRRITLPGPGMYDVLDLPEPVHGTFRLESAATIDVRMTETQVAGGETPIGLDRASLAGSVVTIYFKEAHLPSLTGRVKAAPAAADRGAGRGHHELWNAPRSPWAWAGSWSTTPMLTADLAAGSGPIVLETEAGEAVIDASMIAYVLMKERAMVETTIRRPVMRLTASAMPNGGPIEVGVLYLTKGISWAPSYVIDITDSTTMRFLQQAVIKNELEDFEDATLMLISGYPGIEFGHVLSPLSPATSLASFFAALGRDDRLSHSARADVMAQTVMMNAVGRTSGGDVEIPMEQGMDLKYEDVGRHSMMRGDALLLTTADTTGAYERIVQWVVPELRDEYGNPTDAARRGDDDSNTAWDALRFRNPLDRSLTTGPALVVSGALTLGQQMLYWTSPGEEVVLPVNKSLSVRTRAHEIERENARVEVSVMGSRYFRTTVDGTVQVNNHRNEPVEIVIRRAFRGELVAAEGEPQSILPGEAMWSINPRRELTWTIRLAPGEQKTLTYEYQVLVRR